MAGRARRRSTRPYLFRGLLRCGLCGRVLTGNPNHGRIYYRCKASLREDAITDAVDRFLHEELGHRNLPVNLRKLAEAQHRATVEEDARGGDEAQLKQTLAECDNKPAQYRAALDAGGDPAVVVGWIKETTAIKAATQGPTTHDPVHQTRAPMMSCRSGDTYEQTYLVVLLCI